MHELSIADAIVRIADTHAKGRRVTRVEVKAGHLRQIVPSALSFAFEMVAVGTTVEGAELKVVNVPGRVACRGCGIESAVQGFPLACAGCGGVDVEVVQGEELFVESLELEEMAVA